MDNRELISELQQLIVVCEGNPSSRFRVASGAFIKGRPSRVWLASALRDLSGKLQTPKLKSTKVLGWVEEALIKAYDKGGVESLISEATEVASGKGNYSRLQDSKRILLNILQSLIRDHQIKGIHISLSKKQLSQLRAFERSL